jgi:hypothetical protein
LQVINPNISGASTTDLVSGNTRIFKIICITWLVTKLLCSKLWLATRSFPLVPVSDLFSGLPAAVHIILFAVSLIGMLLFIFSGNKKIAWLFLIAEILSCLCDQNRWQPWEYQFLFMTTAYVIVKDEDRLRINWQLIIAGIYFFSGISKFSSAFIHDIWQNLLLHHFFGVAAPCKWLLRAGYVLPLAEMLAGIGLLTIRMRRPSIWFLAAMHLVILIGIGPFGLAVNSVIWPWNLAMPVILFLLFYSDAFRYQKEVYRKPFTSITLLLWWVMPWLQLAGYWDKYLSSVLYSGGVEQLYICSDNPVAAKQFASFFEQNKNVPCNTALSVYKWGMAEINVPPYPEPRIYRAVAKEWMKKYGEGNNKFMLIKPGFIPRVTELEK